MSDYLSLIDQDTTGNRCDVTPLLADSAGFAALLDDMASLLRDTEFDVIAAVDALGFILGAGLAARMHKGLIAVRKSGKLPVRTDAAEFVDYTGGRKSLELRQDAVKLGTRVLLVDDWVETGAQAMAAITLIEARGGAVVGVAAINIDPTGRHSLVKRGLPCFTVGGR